MTVKILFRMNRVYIQASANAELVGVCDGQQRNQDLIMICVSRGKIFIVVRVMYEGRGISG